MPSPVIGAIWKYQPCIEVVHVVPLPVTIDPPFDVLIVTAPTMTKSKGGIIFTDPTKNEDRFQGKIGMVVKIGEVAFNDPEIWPNEDTRPTIGDWVVYRNADTHECAINKISCRFIKDYLIIGKVSAPDAIR